MSTHVRSSSSLIIIIRQCTECKNHNSYIYFLQVIFLGPLSIRKYNNKFIYHCGLNLLDFINALRKGKNARHAEHLSLFRNRFDKFYKKIARMLYSI